MSKYDFRVVISVICFVAVLFILGYGILKAEEHRYKNNQTKCTTRFGNEWQYRWIGRADACVDGNGQVKYL